MRSLHLLFLISPLSLVAAQDCNASDPFGANCDSSAPAIAIDGALALCNYVLTDCPGGFPAATLCVTNWCKTGCADPHNCCSASNPSSCFQSTSGTPSSSGGGGSDSSSGDQDPGSAECTSVADYVNYCESATPGFTTLPNTAQASCFCFNENGSYNGTAWDDAATSCYAAMATQTSVSSRELSAYSADVVGACTKFVDAGVLSSAGVSSGGGAAATSTPAPAGDGSSSSSSTATQTKGASSGANAGTPSPTVTKGGSKSGARRGMEGCGILLGAVLAMSWIFASL